MQEMGYDEQPYIVYLHNDIERVHLHVVSVRVNLSGKKWIRDSRRGVR